jgi:branched-chain amino acid transport system substrate-binding protein
MKRFYALLIIFSALAMLSFGCSGKPYTCTDPLGCIKIEPQADISIAGLFTLSGPDAPYGIDPLRGVEIAISEKGSLFNHKIALIQQDDLCTEQGGIDGANALKVNPQIVGVIGATCSSGALPAAKILSEVGMVLISPSSTAPSLTDPATHQPGFLRTIYNDKVQGQAVAEFVYSVLGLRSMVTVHDGTAYPDQLQQAACENYVRLGGKCIAQIKIDAGQDLTGTLQRITSLNPDALYYPLYTVDGVALTNGVADAALASIALISSDGLISPDFISQTRKSSQGMYLSGPGTVKEPQAFNDTYKQRYGEDPIASYHLQGYDAAMMLFSAIEKAGVLSGKTLFIPRQALRDALYAIHGMSGLSGVLTCSPTGDCATPNIEIFQIRGAEYVPIYP